MQIRGITLEEYTTFLESNQGILVDYKSDPVYCANKNVEILGGFVGTLCKAVAVIEGTTIPQGILAVREYYIQTFIEELERVYPKKLTVYKRAYPQIIQIVPELKNKDLGIKFYQYKDMTPQYWKYLQMLCYISTKKHHNFENIKSLLHMFEGHCYIVFAWYEQIPVSCGVYIETNTDMIELFCGSDRVYDYLFPEDNIELAISSFTKKNLRMSKSEITQVYYTKPARRVANLMHRWLSDKVYSNKDK